MGSTFRSNENAKQNTNSFMKRSGTLGMFINCKEQQFFLAILILSLFMKISKLECLKIAKGSMFF